MTNTSDGVEVLQGRDVPLGGLRAITVRRTLPHRDRSFIGAWCFVDHYGPQDVAPNGEGGMDVPPHPHTGLQTVSWLFQGEIEHRDSGGVIGPVRPGEVNLMTSGKGIAHSEVSTPQTRVLHGVQLWVALPEADRDTARAFEHFAPEPADLPDGAGTARVFLGTLPGVASSPVQTYTPLMGAELHLNPGTTLDLDVQPDFEYGLLVDSGDITFEGEKLPLAALGCVEPGRRTLRIEVGDEPALLILLGGTPFEEEIVMWWNFVGRDHDEIVAFREEWQARSDRFGEVPGYVGRVEWIPAPEMPPLRLRARNRRGKVPR
ncbi:pirin family protein [Janibacter sp. GXQ6167]|uniref:pirin family protein n=1 Tax=Janibacter sp. GXQ6167 TaxID=3240791 RepID=UPI003523E568